MLVLLNDEKSGIMSGVTILDNIVEFGIESDEFTAAVECIRLARITTPQH